MTEASVLERLEPRAQVELAVRAWLTGAHERSSADGVLVRGANGVALWASARVDTDLAPLRAEAARAPIDLLLWLDLRSEGSPPIDLTGLAARVERRTTQQLEADLNTVDAVAPWASSRLPPPQLGAAEDLWAWLEADLIAEQYVRMAATGGDNARRTSIRRVFIDLPLEQRDSRRHRFVASTLHQGAMLKADDPRRGPPRKPRRLLLGGPGQGKTTLGQYVCQLHRTALLRALRAPRSPEADELMEELATAADGVICKRLPVFITLHHLADALSRGEVDTIEAWIAHRANQRLREARITAEQVDRWLRSWPSFIVFDGLDEVPPSANREQTLAAVSAFLRAHDQADMQVIASTRPQGYRGELHDWEPLPLGDLSPEDVHAYGEKLYASWVPHDAARRVELLRRLDQACIDPTTAHLARSPLQVLILAALVEQSGRAPRERWRLFREYFRIILDRERERNIDAFRALNDHQDLVERLHAEIGYRAQLAGERAGGTADGVPRAEVSRIVRDLLQADYQDPETIQRLVDAVDRVVFDRLVFLSGEGDDRVRFDVRSLQEFFAAERLFLGAESLVPRRLEALCASAHWRNVLLFGVGRLIAERPHLIDRIDPLCDAVDGLEGGLGGIAGSGARLALWLLTDGAVTAKPRLVELLTRRVVERVGELADDDDDLLESIAAGPLELLIPALLAQAEGGSRTTRQLAVNALRRAGPGSVARLEDAVRRGEPWAIIGLEEAADYESSDDVQRLIGLARRRLPIATTLEAIQEQHEESDSVRFDWLEYQEDRLVEPLCGLMTAATNKDDGPAHPSWSIVAPWSRFTEDSNQETLADFFKVASQLHPDESSGLEWYTPWPIAAIAAMPRDAWPQALARLSAGELGTGPDWIRASARWVEEGITDDDLIVALRTDDPFPTNIEAAGVPLICLTTSARLSRLRHIAQQLDDTALRQAISGYLTRRFTEEPTPNQSSPAAQELATLGRYNQRLELSPIWWQDTTWLAWLADFAAWAATTGSWVNVQATPEAAEALLPHVPTWPWLQHWLLHTPNLTPEARAALPTTFDDPRHTWLSVLLRLPLLTPEEVPALATWMRDNATHAPWALRTVPRQLTPQPGALLLLRTLLELGVGEAPALREALRDLLSARPTPLQLPEIARDLGLPVPNRPAPLARVSDDPTQPIHLRRFTLSHVRVWEDQTFEPNPGPEDQGSWLLFVGPNGSGKTTLLRALTLCLLDAPTADSLLARTQGSLVSADAELAQVTLTLSDGRAATARVRGNQLLANGSPPDLFFVGYGPRRGTALGVTRQEVRFQPAEAVETLFIEGGNLIHATSWLKDLHHARLENPGGEASVTLEAVLRALKRLLPGVTHIEVSSAGVIVNMGGRNALSLESLSDGYLTTAGWVLDLIARWVERQRTRGRSITDDLLARMTGLVLIDELDLHLHPRWQWSIVEELRELFPRLSFIATTHNPITLLGARPGEVAVIEVRRDGSAFAALCDVPPGTNAEELLTGPWFGLPSTVDRQTLRLLDEQRVLLRTGEDPQRLAELDAELRRRLGREHTTGAEREAEQLLAQERRRRLEDMTPDEREQARQRAVEALRKAVRR